MTKSQLTLADFAEAKKRVKSKLDAAADPNDERKRLKALKQLAQVSSETNTQKKVLEQFVICISYLLAFARWGGMDPSDLNQISKLTQYVFNFVARDGSKELFNILQTEYHCALGQAYRRDGRHWDALWMQSLALSFSKIASYQTGFQSFVQGIRLHRVGDMAASLLAFAESKKRGLRPADEYRERLYVGKALRLLNRFSEANQIYDELLAAEPGKSFSLEVSWERLLIKARTSHSFPALAEATSKRGSHYSAAYISEAALWLYAQKEDFAKFIPSMQRLRKLTGLRAADLAEQFAVVRLIQESYDRQTPALAKIQLLKKVFSLTPSLLHIEHELLTWVAVARSAQRNIPDHQEIGQICLRRYMDTSLAISVGQSQDLLNLL